MVLPRSASKMPFGRILLAESVYEEETGRISGCNLPHPELFIRRGRRIATAA